MARQEYLTAPPKISTMPPGVPYIVGNEAAERFSYYGMNSILVIFMTKYLLDRSGSLAVMPQANAEAWYHTFVTTAYFLPIVGAVLADALFGKFLVGFLFFIFFFDGHLRLLVIDCVLRRTSHARVHRFADRAHGRAEIPARRRAIHDCPGGRRYQTMCLDECGRSIRRIEQAFAHACL